MILVKLWVDDVRPAPEGYVWCHSVWRAIKEIEIKENEIKEFGQFENIELIDLDHDAGDFACYGGDYIKLLDWFEETGRNYPIRIHSMNPVGVENMRRIIQRNGWTEVK
jgi:hypothetical protein